ncbi:MAG: aminodeoxychorismate/anthranilate synthase component II [Epsilonproteobacteria bacterium]|nr:aminodeoxychorismate/anthranilate synthase component II [Campylobacterota bacterium]NPA57422.1 aminodeoxychorismate/anthranilate synthase component II [Campylobacterota bacterium]
MVLMIDNYDSFTYNVVQYCLELGANLKVVRNDEMEIEEIERLNPEKIIISPGPGTPNEAGISLEIVRRFADRKPILGICLGHQTIAQAFGGEIVQAANMMHGKTSEIEVEAPMALFDSLPSRFRATRYHSLVVNREKIPPLLKITAHSRDDREIMALQVEGRPIFGVQFHPESIMSEYGHEMLDNFLKL